MISMVYTKGIISKFFISSGFLFLLGINMLVVHANEPSNQNTSLNEPTEQKIDSTVREGEECCSCCKESCENCPQDCYKCCHEYWLQSFCHGFCCGPSEAEIVRAEEEEKEKKERNRRRDYENQ